MTTPQEREAWTAGPRFAFDREQMPVGIKRLPTDTRGYVVPWFVDKAAPPVNGNPDFRIMDGAHLKSAVREKRCWVCGMKLRRGAPFAFLAGPMCGINRTSAEPPSHVECAQWSARACPFLSHPKRVRDDRNLPAGQMAGVGILRNPGVAMVWVCDSYETWRPEGGGLLFQLGEPSRVEWVREGREATRAEVLESIETGLPLLLAQAVKDGAEGCFELGRMTERLLAFLPAEALRLAREGRT